MKAKSLLVFFMLISLLAPAQANPHIEALMDECIGALDKNFFTYMVKDKHLNKVYDLAQEIDFEAPDRTELIDHKIIPFLYDENIRRHQNEVYDKNSSSVLVKILYLEKQINTLSDTTKVEAMGKWRFAFLTRLVEYLQYKNSLKKRWSALIVSQSSFDSNLNREVDPNAGPKPSNKSDFQQLLLGNFTWKPFINNKKFSKNWSFDLKNNYIHIFAASHEENEVDIFDTEPVLTRKLDYFFNSISLGWRYQSFANSPSKTSRSTNRYFSSHRLQSNLNSKRFEIKSFETISNSDIKLTASYLNKDHADNTNRSKDAKELKLGYQQKFYFVSKSTFKLNFDLENYNTDNSKTSDYDSFQLKFNHQNKAQIRNFDFKLDKGLFYRSRDKSAGNEDLMGLNIKGTKSFFKKSSSTLEFKYNYLDNATGNAHQAQLILGMNWIL